MEHAMNLHKMSEWRHVAPPARPQKEQTTKQSSSTRLTVWDAHVPCEGASVQVPALLAAKCHPVRHQTTAPAFGSLAPRWGTQLEMWAPASDGSSPPRLQALGK